MGSCISKPQDRFMEELARLDNGDSSVYWLLNKSVASVKADRRCVLAAVAKNGLALDVASNKCKVDKEIILKAVGNDADAYSYVNKTGKIWTEKNFVLSLVKLQGLALEYAKKFNADKELVLAAVKKKGSAIQYANSTLKRDKEVVLAAVENESIALRHVDKTADMWKDEEFVLSIMKMLSTVEMQGEAFSHVSKTAHFWHDKSFVLSMVKMQGRALQFAVKDFKDDSEVALAAIQQNGDALEFVHKKASFWANKDDVLSLVKSTGRALEFASDDIKADKDVVLAAVRSTPTSLKFAQKGLNNDQECKEASGLSICDYQGPVYHNKQQTCEQKEQATLSVNFGIVKHSTDYAANFCVMLERNSYLRNFNIHLPYGWRESSCDPTFTNVDNQCLGTTSTCQFKEAQNFVAETPGGKKKPTEKSCWRVSFQYYLEEAKATNGFMIQVQEKHGLGNGQQIETKMAQEADVKIFRTIATTEDVHEQHLKTLETQIKGWYKKDCRNKNMEEIFLR